MESELDKAELVLAAKGISDEIQSMAEKVAKLQVDELMPLVDRLKEVFGQEMATTFNTSVDETLSAILDNLKQSKDSIENQANVLNGEGDMGMLGRRMDSEMGGMGDEFSDPAMGGMGDMGGMDMNMDADSGDFHGDAELGGMGDEDMFGADDSMAGGDEPLGRAKKESRRIRAKKLAEMSTRMRKVGNMLKVLKARA